MSLGVVCPYTLGSLSFLQGTVPSRGTFSSRLPSRLGACTANVDSEAQGVLARFSQHYENVKHFHESLGGRLGRDQSHVVPEVSRSALFNSLRSLFTYIEYQSRLSHLRCCQDVH